MNTIIFYYIIYHLKYIFIYKFIDLAKIGFLKKYKKILKNYKKY